MKSQNQSDTTTYSDVMEYLSDITAKAAESVIKQKEQWVTECLKAAGVPVDMILMLSTKYVKDHEMNGEEADAYLTKQISDMYEIYKIRLVVSSVEPNKQFMFVDDVPYGMWDDKVQIGTTVDGEKITLSVKQWVKGQTTNEQE